MEAMDTVIAGIMQSFVVIVLLALTACGEGGAPPGGSYGVAYGGSGPVYTLGAGLPTYRLEPRTYWNYPDYRGTGPVIELASRPGS